MDLGFIKENKWFRFRACAVIVRDSKILMCENAKDDYYYTVGGAVEHGEKVEDAVIREVFEETGHILEIDRLLFINQNFFKDNDGKECHEVAFYFLMKDNGLDLIKEGKTSKGIKETTVWVGKDDFIAKTCHQKWILDELANNSVKIVNTYE